MKILVSIKNLSFEAIQKYSDAILRIASDVPHEYWELNNFLMPLEGKLKLSFFVFHDGVPRAYVIASNQKRNYHIHHFMVAKELRSMGVGAMMLLEAEKRATKAGLHVLTLKVLQRNTIALSFYFKRGFTILKKNAGKNGEYLLLKKSLAKLRIIAIHQPNYIPWAGYYYKMAHCDIFVFLDDAQYTKNGFINRNRIKTSQGVKWLTIPVHAKLECTIKETRYVNSIWPQKHLKTLKSAYGRAPYYDEIMGWFSSVLLGTDEENISDLNIKIIQAIAKKLEVSCMIHRSSDLNINGSGDERLVRILDKLNGSVYLSGYGGKKYQDVNKFKAYGITVKYYNFIPPVYTQIWGTFESGLSIIDVLFNCGFDGTRDLIKKDYVKEK